MKKGWLRHLDFISVDFLCTELSLLFTHFLIQYVFFREAPAFRQLYFLIPIINIIISFLLDTYNGILQRGYLKELFALLNLEFFIFVILVLLFYYLQLFPWLPRSILLLYFSINITFTYIFRFVHKFHLRKRYNNVKHTRQIVVVTTESIARDMIHSITASAIRNYQFFGLVVVDKSMTGEYIESIQVSADKENFMTFMKEHVVDEVFINLPDSSKDTLEYARQFLDMGLTVHIYMEQTYQELPNRCISNVFGYNVLSSTISPISFRQALLKRLIDICGGITGCLLTVVIAVFIGPIIFIKSPGPIFFSQTRIGKKGRPFKIYKFRSMYMDAEERKKELMAQNKIQDGMMFKMDNDPRIIKGIGHFIRKSSLDEFPQFWNVLKGEMSLVGTRPPTADEYARYSPHHKRRLSMQPGITGLWQTSGRSSIINFEEVVRLDTQYIENWSIDLDIKIIFKTIIKLFKDEDAK